MNAQDLATIKQTILRVIDDGDPSCANVPWELYQSDCIDQPKANAQRLDFCNRVQELITQEAANDNEVVQLGRVA